MDITTATPVEIDTKLADLNGKIAALAHKRGLAWVQIGHIDATEPGSYQSMLPQNSAARRQALCDEANDLDAQITKVMDEEIAPLNAEYRRRGTWPRYYLVDNTNGHVHKDTNCTTCFADTRYAWLVEQSGMRARDLVELAGEKACTICFPWAPVDVLKQKTRLEAPERKAAREEREAKKAAAAAKKAAKAIANPDGSPLQVFDWHVPERHVKRHDGSIVVHEAHDRFETLPTLHQARGWLTDAHEGFRNGGGKRAEDVQRVADAIAAKEGKTRDQVIEEAKKRAAKRKY
jgi:hypothetical protein